MKYESAPLRVHVVGVYCMEPHTRWIFNGSTGYLTTLIHRCISWMLQWLQNETDLIVRWLKRMNVFRGIKLDAFYGARSAGYGKGNVWNRVLETGICVVWHEWMQRCDGAVSHMNEIESESASCMSISTTPQTLKTLTLPTCFHSHGCCRVQTLLDWILKS